MTVHNIRTEPMRPGDVYIGRATSRSGMHDGYFGNPFRIEPGQPRVHAIAEFKRYARERMETDAEYRERIRGLYGRRLFCWCKPAACHGDVLEKLAADLHDAERFDDERPNP